MDAPEAASWEDQLARDLPNPRRDEPLGLRQDIVDELSDHLQSALARELRKNISQREAIENVRRRFGNVSAIARTLWRDAMKEKIMSQRITVVLVAILACSSMAATGFAWLAVRDGRDANAALAKTNESIMEKLAALATVRPVAPEKVEHPGWSPFEIRLVKHSDKTQPATGWKVTLYPSDEKSLAQMSLTSDAQGRVDFGMLPYGGYGCRLKDPAGKIGTHFSFNAAPGSLRVKTISCPEPYSPPVPVADVKLRAKLPDDLCTQSNLWLFCQIRGSGDESRDIDGLTWNYRQIGETAVLAVNCREAHVMFRAELKRRKVTSLTPLEFDEYWLEIDRSSDVGGEMNVRITTSPQERLSWLEQPYSIHQMGFMRQSNPGVLQARVRGDSTLLASPLLAFAIVRPKNDVRHPFVFKPSAGADNTWTIEPPPLLIDMLRKALAAEKAKKDHSSDAQNDDEVRAMARDQFGLIFDDLPVVTLNRPKGSPALPEHPRQELSERLPVVAIRPDLAGKYNGGLRIMGVVPDSRAKKAGLRIDDVLVGLDQWETTSIANFAWILEHHGKGKSTIKFHIVRGKDTMSGEISLR